MEVELTICSAKDLKNVNWRHGELNPYAVVWVDSNSKSSTKVAAISDGDDNTCPKWEETLRLPFTNEDSTLFIDIVHAYAEQDTKPLIGSARLPIKEIIDDVGFDEWAHRSLVLKRPSGRPQGKLEINLCVRRPRYPAPYGAPATAPAPYPYGGAPSGYPYNPSGYTREYGAPPVGYPVQGGAVYGAPPAAVQGSGVYGGPGYGDGVEQQGKKKGSKFGVGTGLAVGAVAGVLGGLAIAEGVDYVEDKIADDVEERVREDLGLDDDGYDDDDF